MLVQEACVHETGTIVWLDLAIFFFFHAGEDHVVLLFLDRQYEQQFLPPNIDRYLVYICFLWILYLKYSQKGILIMTVYIRLA